MSLHPEPTSISLPIPGEVLEFASRVSEPLAPGDIARRVFGNAIAVATVHNFLKLLDIPSDYRESTLCNPMIQVAADVSDLLITGLGRLECRCIAPQLDSLTVPCESHEDRIGYTFVSFDLTRRQAVIHGFLPKVLLGSFSLVSLRSVEYMLQHLNALNVSSISLTRWLSGLFETEWQPCESLLQGTLRPAFRTASSSTSASSFTSASNPAADEQRQVSRAKKIVWGRTDSSDPRTGAPHVSPVILVIKACQISPLSIRTSVQLYPVSGEPYLEAGLQIAILDSAAHQAMMATSRSIDNYLELQFKGAPGEAFQVQLTRGEHRVVENFQL